MTEGAARADDAVVRGMARILIVDDDPTLSAGLKRALEGHGYDVRAVSRGAQAMEAVARFGPDLLLLDVMMPEVDGWEVLKRLRSNPASAQTPVIMLTAKSSQDAKLTGFSLGADDYVVKPFSLQELRSRVTAVLRRTMARPADADQSIPVVTGASGFEIVRVGDVFFVEGVHNYTYVHTFDARFLSKLTLGALAEQELPSLMRVHRSYIVNLGLVKRCGWVTKSSWALYMGDLNATKIPVSRSLVPEVRRRLGLRQ